MPFPASVPLLDDFNRANESPVSGWPDHVYGGGDGPLEVVGNRLATVANWGNGVHEDVLPDDFDAHITIVDTGGGGNGSIFFHTHLTDPGTSGVHGYAMGILSGAWTITRIDGSASFSNLRSTAVGHDVFNGDKLGVRTDGASLEVWYCPASTGVWGQVEQVNESTYRGGQLGLEINSADWLLDDLYAGVEVLGPTYEDMAADLSGQATLTADLSPVASMSAALSGAGALDAALGGFSGLSASLQGQGTLDGDLRGSARLVAALSGAGELSASLGASARLSATLAGSGVLGAALSGRMRMTGAMTGQGTLSADLDLSGAEEFGGVRTGWVSSGSGAAVSEGRPGRAVRSTAGDTLTP